MSRIIRRHVLGRRGEQARPWCDEGGHALNATFTYDYEDVVDIEPHRSLLASGTVDYQVVAGFSMLTWQPGLVLHAYVRCGGVAACCTATIVLLGDHFS
jgi:hypothetical protein